MEINTHNLKVQNTLKKKIVKDKYNFKSCLIRSRGEYSRQVAF